MNNKLFRLFEYDIFDDQVPNVIGVSYFSEISSQIICVIGPKCLFLAGWLLSFMPIMAHVDADMVPRLYEAMLDALAACELPARRKGRSCRREVRVKMTKFKKKRRGAA